MQTLTGSGKILCQNLLVYPQMHARWQHQIPCILLSLPPPSPQEIEISAQDLTEILKLTYESWWPV